MASGSTLYGPQQSRFARFLERREKRRPDPGAHELRRRLLAGLEGRVLEVGSGDGRSFEHYPPEVTTLLAVEPDPTARESAAERARVAAVPIEIVDGVADPMLCHRGWVVGALDARAGRIATVAYGGPQPGFNGLSAATIAGGELWLGSFQAGRLAVVRGWRPPAVEAR